MHFPQSHREHLPRPHSEIQINKFKRTEIKKCLLFDYGGIYWKSRKKMVIENFQNML